MCGSIVSQLESSFIDRHSGNMTMSLELLDKVCRQLQAIGYLGEIDFSYYNEPLLDAGLEDKIVLVKDRLPKCMVHIVTNGDFLDIERLASLEKAGLDKLVISNYFLPCTGCSSLITDLILMTPDGPFIPRPRYRRSKMDYLERYLR